MTRPQNHGRQRTRSNLAMVVAALLFMLGGGRTLAQEQGFEQLALRVTTALPGGVIVVDRGARDLVAVGDRVLLRPLGGTGRKGAVVAVHDRTAEVTLLDRRFVPSPGTAGVVMIPSSRLEAPAAEPSDARPAPPEHPPWEQQLPENTLDQPLLAEVDPGRPEQRPTRTSGRFTLWADRTDSSLEDRKDSQVRAGLDVFVDNPFGRGGGLHYDGELSTRSTHLFDASDEQRQKLRIDRLSYSWGGTRWEDERHEVGRFLQRAMPEFGLLDGYEWRRRFDDGSTLSASAGAVPTPDRDLSSNGDTQASLSYRWVGDESERFSASAGLQKTWHGSKRDRDLLVAKMHYLPSDDWNMHATAWVDYYTQSDVAKGSGFELTELQASAARYWENSEGASVSYTHRRVPEVLSDLPSNIAPTTLLDGRLDRLRGSRWTALNEKTRLRGDLGAWNDENESGGDVALSLDLDDLGSEGSLTSATAFFTKGDFSSGVGARFAYQWDAELGYWTLSYEAADHDNEGFTNDFSDIVQHWIRVERELPFADDWLLSLNADGRFWDGENAWTLGLFLQHRF